MVAVFVAHAAGNFGFREITAPEQRVRPFDTACGHEGMGRHARGRLEGADELEGAQRGDVGKVGDVTP